MKNTKIKVMGMALLSMSILTGCDTGSPVAPAKESSIPTEQATSNNAENDDKEKTSVKSTKLTQETAPPTTEPTFEAKDYESIGEIDVDLMFNNNVQPQVYDVFPVDEYNISDGALIGLSFMDVLVNNPSFYEPREYGSDAEFFNDTNISSSMTTDLFDAVKKDIVKNGRSTIVPTADLKGRVKFRLMPINLVGVPENKYDTPIIFVEKSKSGENRLAVAGRRTIIFKAEDGSADMKQTIEYYVILAPDMKEWKVSGAGFNTLSPNKLLDSQGKEL